MIFDLFGILDGGKFEFFDDIEFFDKCSYLDDEEDEVCGVKR